MTQQQNTHSPPIADLWLLVDEEQTLRYGLRQSWRWLELDEPKHSRHAASPLPCVVGSTSPAQSNCRHVACAG